MAGNPHHLFRQMCFPSRGFANFAGPTEKKRFRHTPLRFRALLLLVGLVVGVTGCGDDDTTDNANTMTPVEDTTTPAENTVVSTRAENPGTTGKTCSAGDLGTPRKPPSTARGLPAVVTSKRNAILTAALACNYDTLQSLLAPGFTASFGGPPDPIVFWKEQEAAGEPVLRVLALLLQTKPAFEKFDNNQDARYVWPAAATWDPSTPLTAAQKAELKALVNTFGRESGISPLPQDGYLYYRTGITKTGEWTFFVVGD